MMGDTGDELQQKRFKWKSQFIIELSFCDKLKIILSNKAFFWLLCASFFRFAGGYSLGFWAKSYFSGVYPDHENDYALAYFAILVFGGMPSELLGGYICDKYEPAVPGIKGYVSAAGAFLGAICIVFTFLIKTNFWT